MNVTRMVTGFVHFFHRFPTQQPLKICDELLHFVPRRVGATAAGRGTEEAGALSFEEYFCSNLDDTLNRRFRGYSPPIDRPRLPPAA